MPSVHRIIHKYRIPYKTKFELRLTVGAQILAVQVQGQMPCMWIAIDPCESRQETRHFVQVATGADFVTLLTYWGTYQTDGGQYVWHVFEARG